MAGKLGLIALSVVALIAAVATGAVAWLAWFPDTLKPSLERLLTAQLGQQVRIEGPLRIKPGGVTTIEVNSLHIRRTGMGTGERDRSHRAPARRRGRLGLSAVRDH